MRALKSWVAVAATVAMAGAAQAALVLQPNGVEVLDTDTNLLWLHDWSNSPNQYWADAKTWAASLTVGGATAGDWRLPEIGEYADLWTDPDVGSSLSGLQSKFSGVQSFYYWSGTDATDPAFAQAFYTPNGSVGIANKGGPLYAVAVRAGNVTASVPEPQTLALALLALGATVVARRRRSR